SEKHRSGEKWPRPSRPSKDIIDLYVCLSTGSISFLNKQPAPAELNIKSISVRYSPWLQEHYFITHHIDAP
ncbi:MAG: hypothetical protein WBG62_02560, partial [Cyclobacteriaceae bacterium]